MKRAKGQVLFVKRKRAVVVFIRGRPHLVVYVYRRHIKGGVQGSFTRCPIARALRELGLPCEVHSKTVELPYNGGDDDKGHRRSVALPPHAAVFVRRFDDHLRKEFAKPFTFLLPL